MFDLLGTVISVSILVMSVVIHEVAHGVMANYLGDPTARYQGRLTLNPLKHLDPFGSVLLPILLLITRSPILFGWAKPVPYNPYNLQAGKYGEALVAGAGPAINLVLAVLFGLAVRFVAPIEPSIVGFLYAGVATNVMLAFFNLIPVPPLDGSKILSAILPASLANGYENIRYTFESQPLLGFGVVMLFVIGLGGLFGQLVSAVSLLIAGY